MTRSMRSKEHAHDYRYFPDPDLMPLILDPKKIANLKASMPELPDAKKARFVEAYKLSPYDAGVLVAEQEQQATTWLRQALPRRTKVNLRPMGQRDGTLLAQVSLLSSGADIGTGLIEAGLAQVAACP
jgi:Asp-tRNA(Asn)/Glu-tRNA(Gln) amidotransferase B subunit